MTDPAAPGRRHAALRMAVRLLAIVAIAYGAHRLIGWTEVQSDYQTGGIGDLMAWVVLLLVLLAYALLIAIPFVPGIEIGLTILMMQGPPIAPGVYLATLLGLMLGYLAGWTLPIAWLCGIFRDIGLHRAAALLERTAPLTPDERLDLLRARLPHWLAPVVYGWRYPLLALLLNLPGNWLLGGGGGIMLVAGLSRLFQPWATVLTIALAVAPVPLAVWVFGIELF